MAVDVYSFGITLFEIGCCNHHYVTKQFLQASRYSTIKGQRPKPTKELMEMRPGIWKLVQACWHADPRQRPSFVEVAGSVKALDPVLEPGPISTLNSTPMILDNDSAKAPLTQESLEDKQRRAKARYQGLSRDEVDLRLLEAESSRDEAEASRNEAEASRDEMARRLRDAEKRIELLQRSEQQGGSGSMLHQTMTNEKGISLRVTFEYDPDQRASVLGEGAFGTVYAVKSTLDGKSYAMKRLVALKTADGSADSVAMNELLEEVQKLSRVQSEYFVRYVTSSVTREHLFVVMERLHGVEFRDLVVARKALNIPFHEHQIERWLEQLATGLAYLHDEVKLVHQDLHNGNVMITWDPTEEAAEAGIVAADDELLSTSTRVKILDLGLSSFKSEHTTRTMYAQTMRTMRSARTGRRNSFVEMAAQEVCGFKAIRAPEMWAAGSDDVVRFDAKVDVWALGLLMSEAVLCNPIEEWYEDRATLLSFGKDRGLQEAKIAEVSSISTRMGGLIGQMLVKEPRFRLAAREVVQDMKSQSVSIFPTVEERFLCQACSVSEWLSGLGFKSPDDLVAWRQRQMRDTMNTMADDRSPSWKDFQHISIPSNVRCEWRTTKETNARLYRITVPLECTDATLAWKASVKSVGTSLFFGGGDRSMTDAKVLRILDGASTEDANSWISFQVMNLPRPLPKRRFCSVTHVNAGALLVANYPLPLPCEDLIGRSVSEDVLRGTLPGKMFHYSSKFEVGPDDLVRVIFHFQAEASVGESRYHGLLRRAASFSVDRVAIAVAKGCRGIARRIDELADLLCREQRLLNSALENVKDSIT